MPKIVISYRREDTEAITGRIYDRLRERYGADSVFIDIDSIPAGVNFRDFIAQTMQDADLLLAIMGAHWAGQTTGDKTRIYNSSDFVRIEVEKALELKIPIIPVLINGSAMLHPSELPDSLAELTLQHGVAVSSGLDFHQHVDRLVRAADRILGIAPTAPAVPRSKPPQPSTEKTHSPFQSPRILIGAGLACVLLVAGAVVAWRMSDAPKPDTTTSLPAPTQSKTSDAPKPNTTTSLPAPTQSKTPAVPCSEERSLRSLGSVAMAMIVFNNKSDKLLRVYWISHTGERVRYGEIPARQTMAFTTYITHPWLLTDKDDQCLGIYMPATTRQDIDVTF